MLTFAKNLGKLTKKTRKSLKIALAAASLALVIGWLLAWPYPVLNAGHRDNLLLTNGKFEPLKTASPVTLLYNRFWPNDDNKHPRILIRRPEVTDTLKRYPVIVVVQQDQENFNTLAQQWPAMDSCYVMIMSRTSEKSPQRNSLLRLLDTTLAHWLNHCGMCVDPNDVTLIDRTAQGRLASQFTHRRVRNLVLTRAAADTSRVLARRIHLLPCTPSDTAKMAQSFRQMGERMIDADLYPAGYPLQEVSRGIALRHYPISDTRLSATHEQAVARGYDERYVMFADFSIPSGQNRFFVYDYKKKRVIVSSKCAHGCGSGSTGMIPQFSNEHGSCATSLGLYEIDDVHRMYKNGRMAINVEGLEATNDNARMRGIKVHGGMRYEGEIHPRYLRLGKLSEGCFALSNVPLSAIILLVEQAAPRHLLLSAYTH